MAIVVVSTREVMDRHGTTFSRLQRAGVPLRLLSHHLLDAVIESDPSVPANYNAVREWLEILFTETLNVPTLVRDPFLFLDIVYATHDLYHALLSTRHTFVPGEEDRDAVLEIHQAGWLGCDMLIDVQTRPAGGHRVRPAA